MALAIFLLSSTPPCRGETPPPGEYQVKAAYLVRFLKYVELHGEAVADKDSTIVIGILGDSPMWSAASPLDGTRLQNHVVRVRRVEEPEEMRGCGIVFIGAGETGRLGQLVEFAGHNRILTVSDIRRFVYAGGGIGFVNRGKHVRFEINRTAVQATGARISSDLLRLADRIVE